MDPPATTTPAASDIGPYRVEDTLGIGGMGVVYRAVHRQTGATVALKTVRVLDELQLDGLRREIHALSRVHHPGIVAILDQGLHGGVPWYAMELIDGVSLRAWAIRLAAGADFYRPPAEPSTDAAHTLVFGDLDHAVEALRDEPWPDDPDPTTPAAGGSLTEVLELVHRLCAPLAFLHGEGVVHRDLKPDNVLILADGSPVLVDFGLTSQFATIGGRESMALDLSLHGTASYMSPEQIRGEQVDARSDLYALGCIFYELVTGRLPYRSASVGSLLYKHLEEMPVRPSKRVYGVPPELDELILTMLAKRPEDRIGYADDVAAVIASLGAATVQSDAPAARSYLYRPRFAGRAGALAELCACLDDPQRGGVMFVGGESGVGKTRIALELGREASVRGYHVLAGECLPLDTEASGAQGGPLYPMTRPLQAMADRCHQLGLEETERILGNRGPVLAQYAPILTTLPGQQDREPPAVLGPDQAQLRLLSHLTEALEAMADDRRLLLILDDLQWADDLTLQWLGFLLRTEHPSLMVVATYRSDEVTGPLGALLAAPEGAKLSLGRLDNDAVGTMVRDMLALSEPPAPFVDFLAEQSEGIPFYVAEYLRAAVSEGLLRRDRSGRWRVEGTYAALPLPGSLRQLVRRRLDGLSPEARHIAEIAAVVGREVGWALLGRVVAAVDGEPTTDDDGASRIFDAVGQLLAGHIMEEPAPGQLRFVHDKIREVAYEGQDSDRLGAIHGTSAHVMEAFHTNLDPFLGVLGLHWQRAGQLDRARERYLEGARQAADQYAHGDAERFYRGYLDLVEEPSEETVTVYNELIEGVLQIRGRHREGLKLARTALELARRLDSPRHQARTLQNLGALTAEVGRLQDAGPYFTGALDLLRDAGDLERQGDVLAALGGHLQRLGRTDDAQQRFEAVLPIARQCGNRRLEAQARVGLAGVQSHRGRLLDASVQLEQALQTLRAIGDRTLEAHTLNALANLRATQDHTEVALSLYEEALQVERAIGNRLREGVLRANIAIAQHRLGRPDESHHTYQQALRVFRELGHTRFQGHALNCIGRHLRVEGRLDEALELQRAALVNLRAVGDQAWLFSVHDEIARIHLTRREAGGAQRAAETALQLADRLDSDPNRAIAHIHCAQAAALAEEAARAERHFTDGLGFAQRVADAKLAATASIGLARLDRLRGAHAEAQRRLAEVAETCRRAGHVPLVAMCCCELGHLALAAGRDPDPFVAEARRHHAAATYPDLRLQHAIDALASTADAPPPDR